MAEMDLAAEIPARAMIETLKSTLDLVYPVLCAGCDRPLNTDTSLLCANCRSGLFEIDPPFCVVCGEKFHGALEGFFECPNCKGRDVAFEFARSGYFAYGLARELVHRFKYNRQMHLAFVLGELIGRALEDSRIARESEWLLVPVPLHPKRQRRRHFNQAEEICKLVAKSTGWPWTRGLRRVRDTGTQAMLDRRERLRNLDGAFELSKRSGIREIVESAPVLLVDDVLTTGSTVHECAKVLKRDGKALKVAAVTVARAGSPTSGT